MHLVTQGIVLRSAQYGESDRMITLLTPEHGRIDAIARGSRRVKSALLGAVEVFSAGEYTLYAGRDRYSVEQCRVIENFYRLRFDVDRVIHAAYCASLCEAAVQPGEDCRDVFQLLLKALAHLADSELPLPLITSAFEMRLLPLLGFEPRMETCVVCGRPFEGAGRFDAHLGGAVCPDCPSRAPAMGYGARRILYRAPRTDFAKVALLNGHADWPEAARLIRPFVLERIALPIRRILPDLPSDADETE